MKTTTVALSNGLTATVSASTVSISGVSIPVTQFDTAKPYVDGARKVSSPSLNVAGYDVSLKFAEPVISAAGYEFPLSDFDKVSEAIATARAPKTVTIEVLPGVNATISADGITVNGRTVASDVLGKLNAALAEVNS